MTPDQILEQAKERRAESNTPSDVLADAQARRSDSANGSFYVTRDVQPDRASKVISLADRMGAQPDFVDKNLETIEQGEEDAKRQGLLSELPRLANYFADPYRAAEASDSVPNFAEIERAFIERRKKNGPNPLINNPIVSLPRSFVGDITGMVGGSVRGTGDLLSAYVSLGDNLPGMQAVNEWERENLPEWTRQLTPQEYLRTTGGGVAELGEIIKPDQMNFADKVAGALGQIAGAVVTTLTAGPGATAALFFGMGADQQGQAMRRAGIDPDDKPLELASGASVTALSEQMRLGSIMRMMPKEARERVVSKALARIAGQAGEEAVQESVEGILQNLITTTYDADANVFDGILEQAGTAGTAAAIFQALVEVALPGKQRGQRAEQAAQELTDIRTLIEETPVFQRSRQAVENFLNEAGEGETILLHGDDLIELYQSDPQVFEQRMEEIGLSEEDIQRAAQGMDVEVEAAKILSVSEGFEDLVQRVRIDDDTPSLRSIEREVEESDAMGAVDFQEAFERIQEQDQALEGFERVQSAVTEQMLGAGRSQAESEAAGAVWGAMFRQLSEAGVDEGAVFERLGLRINESVQPRMPKPQEPQTLHSYVRSLGGIREAFGEDGSGFMRGEVDSRLGERIPGLINNTSGVTLDEIFRAATEEGGFEIRDTQELLDLLEQDLSGSRVYPIGEAERFAAEMDAYEAQFSEQDDGVVMDQAAEAGYEGTDRGEATEWLSAQAKGLDMSQEARMARAQEMGFDTETVLYHGTTHVFPAFGGTMHNKEGHYGAGHYFTTSAHDASQNYAPPDGPDLTVRIEQRAEQIESELHYSDDLTEVQQKLEEYGIAADPRDPDFYAPDVAKIIARREIAGSTDGQVMPVYLRGKTANVIPSTRAMPSQGYFPTYLEMDTPNLADYMDEAREELGENAEQWEVEDLAQDMAYEVAADQEPTGELWDFISSVRRQVDEAGGDGDAVLSALDDYLADGAASAWDLDRALRSSDLMYLDDPETGALMGNDVIRKAFNDAGFENIRMSADAAGWNMDFPAGTDHVIVSDPSNIRSVNAAFDPDYSDSANLLHQDPPRSLRAAMNMDPQQRSEWYSRVIDEQRKDASGRPQTLEIKPDTRNLIHDEVTIMFSGPVVEFTAKGIHFRTGRDKASMEDVRVAARVMSQVSAVLQEYMLRYDIPFIEFSGATPEHAKLYRSMLEKFQLDGYQAYEATAYSANIVQTGAEKRAVDGFSENDPQAYAQKQDFVIVKDGYEQAASSFTSADFSGELSIRTNRVGVDDSTYIGKGQTITTPLGVDNRRAPDAGDGSVREDGTGSVQRELTPIEPAQRELFQSKPMFNLTQPMELNERVSLRNVQPAGEVLDLSADDGALGQQVSELQEDLLSSEFVERLFQAVPDFKPFQYRRAVELLASGGASPDVAQYFRDTMGILDGAPPTPEAVEIPDSNGLVAIRSDALGFTTSAEKALFDPPPRFRDARNLTADQWRKYFREAGATKEAFEFMIEPALATLPKTGDISKADVIKAVRAQRPKIESKTDHSNTPGRGADFETDYSVYVSPGKHSNYQQEIIVLPEAAAGYRSHNWNTDGVIGHIRTTDRVTTSGETVRFVDELQSDLHQEGAKRGYKGEGAEKAAREARAKLARMRPRMEAYLERHGLEWQEAEVRADDGKLDAEGTELFREWRAAQAQRFTNRGAERQPPRAPAKDWEKPFIRRVLQQAITDGKDVVAFTNHKTLNNALQNEGTQKFYDQRMPAHIRKVAKDLGARVERIDMSIPDNFAREVESGRLMGDEINGTSPKYTQHVLAIRITPEAKAKLAQGNVLFQERRASVLIPGQGALSDQNVLVKLTAASDRTSFLHESAHIFLELYASLESENEVIAERMDAIRKWLKIKPGEQITRDQHEKFAESFEAYLMEGVAPSAELRSVFQQFRNWFIDVYRRLRGQLRNLDPEARDIFDRMLASDVEIEMAQGQYVGTLSKAMEGLMDAEQVEKYQKHARKAGNVARDKLFKKHMAQVHARERKAYKEERGRVEDMARAQLGTWPEYRALAEFREGGRSLNAAQVDRETKLNTSERGEHPEIVAPEMGFRSADEMLKAVEKAPPFERVVKQTTDKIMRDRYGDMMEDGSIEAEAMEAVFNEPSIRMMEAERNAIAHEAAKQRSSDKKRGVVSDAIPLAAIRKRADQIINETPIDKVIKPGRYAIKARDLHKRALRAAAKGKWDEALRVTHQAMLMHELARRAFKARDEVQKINRFLARFAPHRKLDPKKIAADYIAQIRVLMSLPGAQEQTEARSGLNAFADAQANDGYGVVLPADVVTGRDLPIRRRMTMDQLRAFRDGVKSLNTLGRQQSAEAQEAFNAEAQAIADEIDANWTGPRKRETRNPTRKERAAAVARTIDAEIIRWPFLIEALQGGKTGIIIESMETRLRQALTDRNARRQMMADKLAAILKKHGIKQSELNKTVSATVIEAGSVKFEQVLAVALNMGTEQNRDRLVSDPSMNGDLAAIERTLADHLEKRHWDAVQEVWDLINTLWPDASAVERRATGVTPKKVDASSVQTKYGAYRGGYYPLKYDRDFLGNKDLEQQDKIDEWKNGVNGMATRASTQQGFLKERQQNVERPLRLSMDVILSHIDDVTNDIYMREPAGYVSRLLQKRRVQKAITETHGREYLRTLETILKRVVTGTEKADTLFEKVTKGFRINASVAILGHNVVTAGLAPISYFQTVIPQYGFKTVFSGIAEYYSNPFKNAKLIKEKSAFMRERQDTLTREAHELIRKSAGQSVWGKAQGLGYWLMATVEKHSVSGALWVGVYNQSLAEGDSEADAITKADRSIATTQGSGLELDQSVLQGGNESVRLLTFMWGYISGYYGTVRNDVARQQGLRKLMPLLKHMVILNLLASALEAIIRGGFGDEEDPYIVSVMQMMGRNVFGLVPGVSNFVSKYDSGPAVFQVGASGTRAMEAWYKAGVQTYEDGEAEGETMRRAMIESGKFGGFLFGVPGTIQAMKIEKTLAEDDDPTFYEAIVTGPDEDN